MSAKKPKINIVCANCGKDSLKPEREIKANKTGKMFCDMKCRREWQAKQRIIKPCHYCGRQVERRPSDFNRDENDLVFCNMNCVRAWESSTKILIKCEECGKEFERYSHHASRNEHQFCSNQCRGVWHGRHGQGENHPRWANYLLVVCDQCGNGFRQRSATRLKRNRHNFCCMECAAVWSSEHHTGENNHNWKGGGVEYYGPNWYRQARLARKRDDYKCQHCGIAQNKLRRTLDVHHIKPFRTFGYIRNENENYKLANDLTNLISLCQQCHAKAEANMIPIQPKLL